MTFANLHLRLIMKNLFRMLMLVILIPLQGCMEDVPPLSVNFEINDTAEMLIFLESLGDYINNTESFSMLNATEVNAELSSSLIIDIRDAEKFSTGHIQGAVNVYHSDLFDYIQEVYSQNYNKIILIDESGQAASYYTTLLRIYGISNIYFMNWGMASWNSFFAGPWIDVINNQCDTNYFSNIWYERPDYSPLPYLNFQNSNSTIEEKLEERVKILLNSDFSESTALRISTDASISIDMILRNYDSENEEFTGYYIACIIDEALYIYEQSGWLTNPGHPVTTALYKTLLPFSELRSDKFLQTMPIDKTIVLYGYNGHYSAALTAYLRLLGYETKSVLFGYNRMHYNRMLAYPCFENYTFGPDKINNYSYVIE